MSNYFHGMVYNIIIHGHHPIRCLAHLFYVPTALFHGISDFMNAVRGRVSHAYKNWRDYHYCPALIVSVVLNFPIFVFFVLIDNGFNPYKELTP